MKKVALFVILLLACGLSAKTKVGDIIDPGSGGGEIPAASQGEKILVSWDLWRLSQIDGEWAIFACIDCGYADEVRVAVQKKGLGPLRKGQYLVRSSVPYDNGDEDVDGNTVLVQGAPKLRFLGYLTTQTTDGFDVTVYRFEPVK
jgi:hypothetical protein